MDTKEGERRLYKALTLLAALFFWIPGIILLVLCFPLANGLLLLLSCSFIFMGFFVHEIFGRAVLWIIKGFAGEDIFAEEENDY